MEGWYTIISTLAARWLVIAALMLFAALGGVAAEDAEPADDCGQRIVALSPSLVEVIDVLGLTDRLVAVSRYAKYPPAVSALPSIGGLLDPNTEGILFFKPTLVIGLSESADLTEKLKKFSVPVHIFDHRRISGILDSIGSLSARCGVSDRGNAVLMDIRRRVENVRLKTLGKNRLRALVLVGNKVDALRLTNLYVSGRDGFYTDLLQIIGVRNVFQGLTGAFSGVSREALIREDPDIIFQVISDQEISMLEQKAILANWATLPYLKAVKNKKIFLLTEYVDNIPGPRFPEVLEKMERLVAGE